MRRILQALAVLTLLWASGFWLVRGANRGWTKTSVPVVSVDEVTGIEGRTYVDRFVPGVDFLGAAAAAGGLMTAASLLLSKSRKTKTKETQTQVV
jgi:hypothetical protein